MRRVKLWRAAAVLTLLWGCGGDQQSLLAGTPSGDVPPAEQVEPARGSLTVSVVWPERPEHGDDRLIPAASNSIRFELIRDGTATAGLTIDRPVTTGSFTSVPAGTVTLRATAYPEAGASGTAQATADSTVTIVAGQSDSATVTLVSTIQTVEVSTPDALLYGGTAQMTATAEDSSGATVLVPTSGAYTWSVTAGSDKISIDTAGNVTGSASGTATVQAEEKESGVKGTLEVTVPTVAVSVSPTSVTLGAGQQQTFTATVTGAADTTVNWSVQEGSTGGSVDASGLYIAPGTTGTYHVVATSQADSSRSAVALVTVGADPVSQLMPIPTSGCGRKTSRTTVTVCTSRNPAAGLPTTEQAQHRTTSP